MDDCKHETVVDRMCDECGMVTEPLEFLKSYNTNNSGIPSVTHRERAVLFRELINMGIEFELVKHCQSIVDDVSRYNMSTLKGRRKRGLVFATIFARTGGDPHELCKKMGMKPKECASGMKLYEHYIGCIKWSWAKLLKCKLDKLNLSYLYDKVCAKMLETCKRKKGKIVDHLINSIEVVGKENSIELLSRPNLMLLFACS